MNRTHRKRGCYSLAAKGRGSTAVRRPDARTAGSHLAVGFVTRLGHNFAGRSYPIEVNSLSRTLIRWRHQISAWHQAHHPNAAAEAANNPIKRVKRAAPPGTYSPSSRPADSRSYN